MGTVGYISDGDRAFVIDPVSATWVVVPAKVLPLFKLLPVAPNLLPAELQARLAALQKQLVSVGFGREQLPRSTSLNTLILKITKTCNYRCKYCYDMEPEDKLTHMSYDVASAAIEEALTVAARPPRRFTAPDLLVILHGGEPTLFFRSLIKPIVLSTYALAEKLRKKVQFVGQTNLSRLDEDMVKFSLDHNIGWGISLDGPPSINDQLRVISNDTGSYTHFADALARFPDFVRSCGVMSTITSHNQSELLPIARHFHELGIRSWSWSLFHAIGRGRDQRGDLQLSEAALLNSWDLLFEAVLDGEFDGFAIGPILDYLDNLIMGPGDNMCLRRDCGAARDLLSISADGTIGACDCIDRKGSLGSLGLIQIERRDSLARAQASPVAEQIRSRDVTRGSCRTCMWLAACGGTCLAHAGELHGTYAVQCAVAMHAFSRIATSLIRSNSLRRYWESIHGDNWCVSRCTENDCDSYSTFNTEATVGSASFHS